MCGIAAAINVEKAGVKVTNMLRLLRGRGDVTDPVGTPVQNVALGTRRLKILDRDNAEQPFWSYDNKWIVVLNGEIYNFQEIRHDLEKQGISFKTNTDTEMLAHALSHYGTSCVELFNGMYAFVAYNTQDKTYIAARDPLGIKPLYYTKDGNGICFASEIKPLLEFTEKTQIEIVLPGYIYTKQGKTPFQPRLPKQRVSSSLSENAETLYKLLKKSVASQLPPDLDCAIKFSGGIDSTLLLHLARKIHAEQGNKNTKIAAYHISREDGKDRPFAMEYAEKMGIDLRMVDFSREDAMMLLPRVIESVESFEPNMIRNSIVSYLLSEKIHNDGIKVALCGEGADELFCGYAEMRQLANPLATRERFLNDLHKTQLQRADRTSMQFELETRVPFLDAEIVQFAQSLPEAHLVGTYENAMMEKIILREAYKFEPDLPNSIRMRSKVVFADGAGLGDNSENSPFFEYAQLMLSEKDYKDGLKRYERFKPKNKEEVYYLNLMAKSFDLSRLDMLTNRPFVNQNSL